MPRLLILILIALLLAGCEGFDAQAYVPGLETATPPHFGGATPIVVNVTPSAVPATLSPVPSRSQTTKNTGAGFTVCTGTHVGKLHVRFEAGETSEVRGYVLEGEAVIITDESKTMPDGSTWIKLQSPIEGWVNSKYICSNG